MGIVAKIQDLCPSKSTSLPKLEKELGFSNGSTYKWDTNAPSVTKVLKVAQYFGVSVDYLLGVEKKEEVCVTTQQGPAA